MSDNTEIAGHAEAVLDTETFPSGFSKRILVINTGGKYPQTIPVEFVKDKTSLLDDVTVGQEVTAFVNIRGNEYNGRYYANIQGWKLDKGERPSTEPRRTAAGGQAVDKDAPEDDEYDDIPF